MEKTYYIGLDVGSTTAKIAVINTDNRVIYSKYERHNARVNELVSQYLPVRLILRRKRSSILVARTRRLSSSRKTEIWNCA